MEIFRRSLCPGVMVLSALVIHTTSSSSGQNATSLSFVVFDRSIEAADGCASENSSQALALSQKQNKRTTASYFEIFKGIRTPFHQSHYPLEVFPSVPRANEFPKADGVWQAQQPAGEVF